MKKLLFDLTSYQGSTAFHGGGEYCYAVIAKLLEDPRAGDVGVFFYWNKHIDEKVIRSIQKRGWGIHPICDFREITSVVKTYHYEKIYSPIAYSKMWGSLNLDEEVTFIGTFHGTRDIEISQYAAPENCWFENNEIGDGSFIYETDEDAQKQFIEEFGIPLLSYKKHKIITVSETSKSALLYYFPELDEKTVEVLYSPSKLRVLPIVQEEEVFLKKWNLKKENYGLLISGGIYYKNDIRAAMAFDKIFDEKRSIVPDDFKVVILGIRDRDIYLERIRNKERFVLEGYVGAYELEVLYKNAHVFVFPSLNEGFGYPPVEAMSYGTICACSAGTSIPEICGEMVVYFNPFLINEIACSILKCFVPRVRETLREKIRENLPKLKERQQNDLNRIVDILVED